LPSTESRFLALVRQFYPCYTFASLKTVRLEKVRGTEGLYRYPSNDKYYARFVVNGKELRRSLGTTDRALAKRKLLQMRETAKRIDPAAERLTLAGLCDRYLSTTQNLRPKTVAQKMYVVARIKEEWPGGSDVLIRKVLPSHAQTFLSRYTFGASSYNAYLGVLRAMFQLAVADGLIAESPIRDLRERRRAKPIRATPTWEQFQSIVADVRAQQFNADAQDSADFLEFLGLAGLGQAEARSLRRCDVDLEADRIITFRHKTTTGFAIPIFPQLRPLVERLCGAKTNADRIFKIADAKRALAGACRRLGLPPFSQRSLRRLFITRAIEKGVKDGGKLILDTYSHVNRVHSQRMAQLMSEERPETS
jgi:integrase